MKVLVTGAAGFLGSHLMLHHMQRGDSVLGIDDYSSSKEDSEHVKHIVNLCNVKPQHSNSSLLVPGNITEKNDIKNALWLLYDRGVCGSFDRIYNFACPASPPVYQSRPVHTLMTCTTGFKNVLDLAGKNTVVVHASTSEVYGDPELSPQDESYRGSVNSYGPRSCYDEGKRAAEALCYDYLNTFKKDVRLVRIFNTYGPHMDPNDGRVVSNFITQALRGEFLTVYGTGVQSRSFCYVDDLIRGIVAVGDLKSNPHGPINLGNPHEFTMIDLARMITKKIHGNDTTRITFEPLPTDDPRQRRPNISRAKELLGWEPKVMLDEGLDRTIDYFRRVTSQFDVSKR